MIRAIPAFNERMRDQGVAMEYRLVHTGQHYDANMSDSIFRDLGMREPDVNFHVASGTHAEQTAAVMTAFDAYLVSVDPDAVVVVGGAVGVPLVAAGGVVVWRRRAAGV